MALFLGTYNVPTNKKLIVNGVGVTLVYSNGVVVWRYVHVPVIGSGGLPVAGSKGHWIDTGNKQVHAHHRDVNGAVTSTIHGNMLGYGEKLGAITASAPDTGASPTTWHETYAIMKWVPA